MHPVARLLEAFAASPAERNFYHRGERPDLIRKLVEHPSRAEARNALETLLLTEPHLDLSGPSGAEHWTSGPFGWRDTAWDGLFMNHWSDDDAVAFMERILARPDAGSATRNDGDSVYKKSAEALQVLARYLPKSAKSFALFERWSTDPIIGTDATAHGLDIKNGGAEAFALGLIKRTLRHDMDRRLAIKAAIAQLPKHPELQADLNGSIIAHPDFLDRACVDAYFAAVPKNESLAETLSGYLRAASTLDQNKPYEARLAARDVLTRYLIMFHETAEARSVTQSLFDAHSRDIQHRAVELAAWFYPDEPSIIDRLRALAVQGGYRFDRIAACYALFLVYSKRADVRQFLRERRHQDVENGKDLDELLAGRPHARIFQNITECKTEHQCEVAAFRSAVQQLR